MNGRGFSHYVDDFRASGALATTSAALVLHGEAASEVVDSDTTAMGREPNRLSMDWLGQEAVSFSAPPPSAIDTRTTRASLARPREELGQVFLVGKRPGNAFDHISVGRAQNVDVVLTLQRVSKFHAYFLREADQFLLADAGSTNGTWIGTKRLAVRRPEPVKDGDRIRLGPYGFTFYTPTGFATLVRGRAK